MLLTICLAASSEEEWADTEEMDWVEEIEDIQEPDLQDVRPSTRQEGCFRLFFPSFSFFLSSVFF